MTQEGLSEALAPLGKYERIIMRMFFFPAFYEQLDFLNGLCAVPGSNTPAYRVVYISRRAASNGQYALLQWTYNTYVQYRRETVCTSLSAYPHFFYAQIHFMSNDK
jgi:hypothetical protein